MPIAPATRQELLELDPLEAKLRRIIELLQDEVSVRELGQKITSETQQRMSKTQRDFFLREQLRSIQHELVDVCGLLETSIRPASAYRFENIGARMHRYKIGPSQGSFGGLGCHWKARKSHRLAPYATWRNQVGALE